MENVVLAGVSSSIATVVTNPLEVKCLKFYESNSLYTNENL
jgi:hypothetical protein